MIVPNSDSGLNRNTSKMNAIAALDAINGNQQFAKLLHQILATKTDDDQNVLQMADDVNGSLNMEITDVHSEGNHFFQVLNPKLETTDIVDHLIEEKIEIEQFHIQKATDIAANDTVLLNIDSVEMSIVEIGDICQIEETDHELLEYLVVLKANFNGAKQQRQLKLPDADNKKHHKKSKKSSKRRNTEKDQNDLQAKVVRVSSNAAGYQHSTVSNSNHLTQVVNRYCPDDEFEFYIDQPEPRPIIFNTVNNYNLN